MKISEATIEEFRQAVRGDYEREITSAEASEVLRTLVGYFDLLAKIHHRKTTKNNHDNKATNN